MARLRISTPARGDLEHVLATSAERWGEAARRRYEALIATALRAIARNPEGPATRDRAELLVGVRSLHIRHVRGARGVKEPVHVIFFRQDRDVVEVVRVLHERMEPTSRITAAPKRRSKPPRR